MISKSSKVISFRGKNARFFTFVLDKAKVKTRKDFNFHLRSFRKKVSDLGIFFEYFGFFENRVFKRIHFLARFPENFDIVHIRQISDSFGFKICLYENCILYEWKN